MVNIKPTITAWGPGISKPNHHFVCLAPEWLGYGKEIHFQFGNLEQALLEVIIQSCLAYATTCLSGYFHLRRFHAELKSSTLIQPTAFGSIESGPSLFGALPRLNRAASLSSQNGVGLLSLALIVI
jgi:hypothetical protein